MNETSYYAELKEIAIATQEIVKTGDLEKHRDAMRDINQRMLDVSSEYGLSLADIFSQVTMAMTLHTMEQEGIRADDSLLPATH